MTHVVENFPMPLPLGLKTLQEMSYLRPPMFNAKTPHINSPNINSKGQPLSSCGGDLWLLNQIL